MCRTYIERRGLQFDERCVEEETGGPRLTFIAGREVHVMLRIGPWSSHEVEALFVDSVLLVYTHIHKLVGSRAKIYSE